jgi:hypothetical protein
MKYLEDLSKLKVNEAIQAGLRSQSIHRALTEHSEKSFISRQGPKEVKMSTIFFLKQAVAFGLLVAVLLAAQVYAMSLRSAVGSDYFERHPIADAQANIYVGSDWIERHPPAAARANIYAGSDYFERHPLMVLTTANYVGSDWVERHPSDRYAGSDFSERHPSAVLNPVIRRNPLALYSTYINTDLDWIERHR